MRDRHKKICVIPKKGNPKSIWSKAAQKAAGGRGKLFNSLDLTIDESLYIFNMIMGGEISEIDTTAILVALKIKKETKNEILGATKIMREKSIKISSPEM